MSLVLVILKGLLAEIDRRRRTREAGARAINGGGSYERTVKQPPKMCVAFAKIGCVAIQRMDHALPRLDGWLEAAPCGLRAFVGSTRSKRASASRHNANLRFLCPRGLTIGAPQALRIGRWIGSGGWRP